MQKIVPKLLCKGFFQIFLFTVQISLTFLSVKAATKHTFADCFYLINIINRKFITNEVPACNAWCQFTRTFNWVVAERRVHIVWGMMLVSLLSHIRACCTGHVATVGYCYARTRSRPCYDRRWPNGTFLIVWHFRSVERDTERGDVWPPQHCPRPPPRRRGKSVNI